jgi:hypothetical protein
LEVYHLAIAWCWEYDADFVRCVDRECGSRGIKSYLISSDNLSETLQQVQDGELRFRTFFDRASDQQEAFDRLVRAMQRHPARMINDADRLKLAIDKAAMQKRLSSLGVGVPRTFVLPPWCKRLRIDSLLSETLSVPFVVKPATGGCGDGVVKDARTVQDVQKARQLFPHDRYLLQERIEPAQIGGRRAWFRVFFAFGEVLPCWWDDQTRVAHPMQLLEVDEKIYSGINAIIRKTARVCRLDLFSSEIALTPEGELLVIDPVNDQVDLRKKSSHADGVPDKVVDRIASNLVGWVEKSVKRGLRYA